MQKREELELALNKSVNYADPMQLNYLLITSCKVAEHKKYSCFNLNSLPPKLLSLGYKTLEIFSAIFRSMTASKQSPSLKNFKLKFIGDLADHNLMVLTTLLLYPGMGLSQGMAKTVWQSTQSRPSFLVSLSTTRPQNFTSTLYSGRAFSQGLP